MPNNTREKSYNVLAPVLLPLDMDATVPNLTLQGGFDSRDHSFFVVGKTMIAASVSGATPDIRLTAEIAPVTFATGTLSTFASGVLTGKYELNGAATLQFGGANITTLRSANLVLNGAGARIVDENGNNAFRSLTHIEADAYLDFSSVPFVSAGDMTVDGYLNVGTQFVINGALTNFDAATRTLNSGSYSVSAGGTLQFRGADIVNNAATISVDGDGARFADEAGRDGLRNFAHNLPTGEFHVYFTDFVLSNDFTNDGLIDVEGLSLTISGSLTNYDPTTRRLAGGSYQLGSEYTSGNLKFKGADIVHNAASLVLINGAAISDENGNDALRNLADNEASGVFQATHQVLNVGSDFTNNGTISLYESAFSVPAGHVYHQTGGKTYLGAARLTAAVVFDGGELDGRDVRMTTRDGGGVATISGNVTINDLEFGGPVVHVDGSVQLPAGGTLRYVPKVANVANTGLQVNGTVTLAGALQIVMPTSFPVGSYQTFQIAHAQTLSGVFSNAPNGTRLETSDGLGSFVVSYSGGTDVFLSSYQRNVPAAQLLNISTRAQVLTGDDVEIGGFMIDGPDAKKVLVRAIGPSLSAAGVAGPLQDPIIELHDSRGSVITTNDNWQGSQASEVQATGLAPADPRESAIVATLQPGAYTVVLRGNNSTTGIALAEVYDLSPDSQSKLANISTRGFVDADHVLIGGSISGGSGKGNAELVVRAIGDELKVRGVTDFLADPVLEVRDQNGALLATNDNFNSPAANAATVPAVLGIYNQFDAATGVKLPAGKYTVIVRGKNGASGVALVEIYDLNG